MGKKLFVIYPGRFHPFHKGHKSVYDYLNTKYGGSEVFITTTDKVELPKSPFNFQEKVKMMTLTGIPLDRIIQVTSNYNLINLVGRIPIDIKKDSIIFAVSEKDMMEDPRFSKFVKKDGSPAYLQPLPKKITNLEPAEKHGYIDTVPTTDFVVLGKPARSASELRSQYTKLTPKEKKLFIGDLFGKYSEEVKQIMDTKLNPTELNEKQKKMLRRIIIGMMKEDEAKVQSATHKANLAFVNQRQAELDNAEEKRNDAKEKLDKSTTPEEKDSAETNLKTANKNVDAKKALFNAAKQQAKA